MDEARHWSSFHCWNFVLESHRIHNLDTMKKRLQLVALRLIGIFLILVLAIPYIALTIVAHVLWMLYGIYAFFSGLPIEWFEDSPLPDKIAFHRWVAKGGVWVYDLFKFKIFEYEKNG